MIAQKTVVVESAVLIVHTVRKKKERIILNVAANKKSVVKTIKNLAIVRVNRKSVVKTIKKNLRF